MQKIFKFFGGSIVFTILALGAAFWVGYEFGNKSVAAGLTTLFTAFMLGILETSLSFDNAVVNAKVLKTMTPFWQKMFLTVGMIIAVFGMRIVFPLVIVWIVGNVSFGDVLEMTWKDPHRFQEIIEHQHVLISGFGGAFLWMVFTKFFFDTEKEVHWIKGLENTLSHLGRIEAVWVAITMVITMTFFFLMPEHDRGGFLMAAMIGIITYILVEGLSSLLESGEEKLLEKKPGPANGTKAVAMGGFGAFMYLEVLDASFSFDGVIGAFAITDNLYIIALGLGIGAFFVRSMTIKLVVDGTLDSYPYLEHGAFWAIGALSLIMYLNALGMHIPEVISGTVGIVFIGLSFVTSVLQKRKQKT